MDKSVVSQEETETDRISPSETLRRAQQLREVLHRWILDDNDTSAIPQDFLPIAQSGHVSPSLFLGGLPLKNFSLTACSKYFQLWARLHLRIPKRVILAEPLNFGEDGKTLFFKGGYSLFFKGELFLPAAQTVKKNDEEEEEADPPTLFSMEVEGKGGIRIVWANGYFYYEVVEVGVNSESICVGKWGGGQLTLQVTHERRLYGRGLLHVRIGEDTWVLEVTYPALGESPMTFSVLSGIESCIETLALFNEPFTNNATEIPSSPDEFRRKFGSNIRGLVFLLTPLSPFPSICPLTLKILGGKVPSDPPSWGTIFLLLFKALPPEPNQQSTTVITQFFRLLPALLSNPALQTSFANIKGVQLIRILLERGCTRLDEQLTRYLINSLRAISSDTLLDSALHHLPFNPCLQSLLTPAAQELLQDFQSVFYSILCTLPSMQSLLPKRIFMLAILNIVHREYKLEEEGRLLSQYSLPFAAFICKFLKKIPVEELGYLYEAAIWAVNSETRPAVLKMVLSTLQAILEFIKDEKLVTAENPNPFFTQLEEPLLASLLGTFCNAPYLELKVDSLRLFYRYTSQILNPERRGSNLTLLDQILSTLFIYFNSYLHCGNILIARVYLHQGRGRSGGTVADDIGVGVSRGEPRFCDDMGVGVGWKGGQGREGRVGRVKSWERDNVKMFVFDFAKDLLNLKVLPNNSLDINLPILNLFPSIYQSFPEDLQPKVLFYLKKICEHSSASKRILQECPLLICFVMKENISFSQASQEELNSIGFLRRYQALQDLTQSVVRMGILQPGHFTRLAGIILSLNMLENKIDPNLYMTAAYWSEEVPVEKQSLAVLKSKSAAEIIFDDFFQSILENSLWLKSQPKGSLKIFTELILQYFYIQLGLCDSGSFEILNFKVAAAYNFSSHRILEVLNCSQSESKNLSCIKNVVSFCETYFWRDFTFLYLDVQKEWQYFCENAQKFEKENQKFIMTYTDVLLFEDEGLTEEKGGAYCKLSLSILLFQMYLYLIDASYNALSGTSKVKSEALYARKLNSLQELLSKTTRYFKYVLLMLELVAKTKFKRKDIVYRCHFEYIYIVYLNFLFSKIEHLEGLSADSPQIADVQPLLEKEALQAGCYVLVLAEYSNSVEKNFEIIVKMRRQKFPVQCDLLSYKILMETLMYEGQEIIDLSTFDVHKKEIIGSSMKGPFMQKLRSCVLDKKVRVNISQLFPSDYNSIQKNVQAHLVADANKFITLMQTIFKGVSSNVDSINSWLLKHQTKSKEDWQILNQYFLAGLDHNSRSAWSIFKTFLAEEIQFDPWLQVPKKDSSESAVIDFSNISIPVPSHSPSRQESIHQSISHTPSHKDISRTTKPQVFNIDDSQSCETAPDIKLAASVGKWEIGADNQRPFLHRECLLFDAPFSTPTTTSIRLFSALDLWTVTPKRIVKLIYSLSSTQLDEKVDRKIVFSEEAQLIQGIEIAGCRVVCTPTTLIVVRPVRRREEMQMFDSIVGKISINADGEGDNQQEPQIAWYSLESIVTLVKEPFLHIHRSLELKFDDYSTVTLGFAQESTRDKVFNSLISYCRRIDLTPGHKVKVLSLQSFSFDGIESSLTTKWANGQLSNFSYLMALNKCAGRSVSDPSRYPIFPWCVKSFDTDQVKLHDSHYFRDLSKPLGFCEENERAAGYEETFKQLVKDKDPHPYYFGTYISNPATVFYYLARLRPYSLACRNIFGKMDSAPERIFHSLIKHYRTITTVAQDLKECLPEFYYLPELFQNVNDLTIESRPTENWRIAGCELPRWAKNSPYNFVYLHRIILESEAVSAMLPQWINLHFGSWLHGKKAFEHKNIYHPAVYSDFYSKKLKGMINEKEATPLYSQMYHFGQIPLKLFEVDHPSRSKAIAALRKSSYANKNLKILASSCSENSSSGLLRGATMELFKDRVTIATTNWIKTVKYSLGRDKDYRIEKIGLTVDRTTQINKVLALPSNYFKLFQNPFYFSTDHNVLVIGGFLDLCIRVVNPATGEETRCLNPNDSVVTALGGTSQHLAAGCANGDILFWRIFPGFELRKHARITDRVQGAITSLKCIEDSPMITAATRDGYVLVANLVEGCLLRKLQPFDGHPVDEVSLSFGSPGCIFSSCRGGRSLSTHSLNGQLLSRLTLEQKLSPGMIIQSGNEFGDIGIVFDNKQSLIVLQLPFLKVLSIVAIKTDGVEGSALLNAEICKENNLIVLVFSSGEVVFVTPH